MRQVLCVVSCVWSALSFAQTPATTEGGAAAEPAAAAAEAPAAAPAPKWYEKLKLEGIVEGYYSYRFQGKTTDRANELRAFDVNNNVLTPSWGKLAVSMPASPVGFRVDLAFGPVADLGGPDLTAAPCSDPAACTGGDVLGYVSARAYRNLLQGYASAKFFDKLTVDFGKFYTSAGAEIFENNGNWMASRSMIFTYGPYTHAGLRMNFAATDFLTIQGSVVNGWDNVAFSISPKMFNLSAFLTLPTTTVALNFYGGPQSTPDPRLLFDLVVGQTIDKLGLNLNGIFGTEGSSKWYAGALMAKYQVLDSLRIAVRVEYFADPDGHRTAITKASYLNSTLAVGYIVTNPDSFGTVEIRPEIRHDQQLSGDADVYVGGTSKSQTTASITMFASF